MTAKDDKAKDTPRKDPPLTPTPTPPSAAASAAPRAAEPAAARPAAATAPTDARIAGVNDTADTAGIPSPGSQVTTNPPGSGRPAVEVNTPTHAHVASGEVHTTLSQTARPTEAVRPDDPTAPAILARNTVVQPAVVTGETMAAQTALARAQGAPNPELPNDPFPPGYVAAPGVVPGVGLSPTEGVMDTSFHDDELAVVANKPSVGFINGQPAPGTAGSIRTKVAPGLSIGVVVDHTLEALRTAGAAFLHGTGRNANEAAGKIRGMVEELRPHVEALAGPAVAGDRGALRELGLIRDRIAATTVDVAEEFADEERVAFNAAMTATLTGVINAAVSIAGIAMKAAAVA